MTSPSPTTSANVKRIVAAFEFARMQRELERRRQRLEKLFTTTSVASATPSSAPLVSLSFSASSTTPPPPPPTASASIDNTTLSSTTTRGPLPARPARCSTPGHTHDESTLVPVSAASVPSSTSSCASSAPSAAPAFPLTAAAVLCAVEDIFSTMPTKCSTNCFSRDNMLKSGNTINKCFSLENMQHRYITNSIPACSFDVMLPTVATKVLAEQNVWDSMIVLNPVLLEQLPATVVNRAPRSYILNVETVDISPKPPWSVVCLEADNAKGNFNSQIIWMLSPLIFSGYWRSVGFQFPVLQHLAFCKVPWPPPILIHVTGNDFAVITMPYSIRILLSDGSYKFRLSKMTMPKLLAMAELQSITMQAILFGGDNILLIHVASSVRLQMCCKAVQALSYNSGFSAVFVWDISKILFCVLWLSLIDWYFSQLWRPPWLSSVHNSFKMCIQPVLNKQHNRGVVGGFLWLSSEHMMEFSDSWVLCNILAVQEIHNWASPDAINPISFMCLYAIIALSSLLLMQAHIFLPYAEIGRDVGESRLPKLYGMLLVNSKQGCFTQLWKPPWMPLVYTLLQGRFTELVANKKRSGSVVEMFLWHTLPEVMSNHVLVKELIFAHMIQVSTCCPMCNVLQKAISSVSLDFGNSDPEMIWASNYVENIAGRLLILVFLHPMYQELIHDEWFYTPYAVPKYCVIKLQILQARAQEFLEHAVGRMTLWLIQFYHRVVDDP